MPRLGTVHKGKEREREIEWQIPNFFSLSRKVDEYDLSPDFLFSGETWFIQACLNGESDPSSVGYIGLYLMKKRSNSDPCVSYIFFLKKANGVKKKLCYGKVLFQDGYGWGARHAINKITLLSGRKKLIPSGVLRIVCFLKLEDEHIVRRTERLSEDLKKISLSGDDSDVTVSVKGEKFRLHRNILSTRSPVFHAMLKHDMKEKATGIVVIDDCEVDTFRQFVEYVYTGTIEKLTKEDVFGLFEISDKYQLPELKEDCVPRMQNMISVDNFFDVITLEIRHGNPSLLEITSRFFTKNMKEVIKSEKWQEFMKENSAKANELLIKALDNYKEAS